MRELGFGTLVCLATFGGCGPSPLCSSGSTCRTATCDPSQPCGLETGESQVLEAIDWKVVGPAHQTDALVVGGPRDARVHLAFGPLPETPERARLQLHPASSASPPHELLFLEAESTDRFFGRDSSPPEPRTRGYATRSEVPPSAPRLVTFDVTEAAQEARGRALYLRIAQVAGSREVPVRLTSPTSEVLSSRPLLTVWSGER